MNRASVSRSARWSLLSLTSKQVSRILFSLLLARLLGPENFGIIAQATIYIAFSIVFLDGGVGASLIQRKNVDRETTGTATTLNLGVLTFLVVATQLSAPLWADFFGTPELESVLRVLSLTYVFNGLMVVPLALLVRRIEFKLLGIAEVISSIVSGVAGVIAAVLGAEYWALVIQTLTRDVVMLMVVLRVTGPPVVAWSRRALSQISSFSRNAFGSQLLGFAGQNTDNILIGWRLGAVALANYALGYRMLLLPVQILGQTANRMVFPIFSRLNDDKPRQARYFLMTVTSLSLIVVPLMVLVALAAPDVVPLIFGPEWHDAIRPMQILAIVAIFRALLTVNAAVILAAGKATWVFRRNLVAVPVHMAAFAVGLRWGIDGVAWSFLLTAVPLGAILIPPTSRVIPVTANNYFSALTPAVVASAIMVVSWPIADRLIGASVPDLGRLMAVTGVAALSYVAALARGWPGLLRGQLGILRSMVRPGKP